MLNQIDDEEADDDGIDRSDFVDDECDCFFCNFEDCSTYKDCYAYSIYKKMNKMNE
jgi:hypothetical protein